jgi:hypothetical protein
MPFSSCRASCSAAFDMAVAMANSIKRRPGWGVSSSIRLGNGCSIGALMERRPKLNLTKTQYRIWVSSPLEIALHLAFDAEQHLGTACGLVVRGLCNVARLREEG